MTVREPFGQGVRLLAIAVLLAALFGLIVWSGASPADPMETEAPTEVDVASDRESYVGEQVALGGEVVETDPIVIATRASGYGQFTVTDTEETVQNTDEPLETGDQVTAYGTLEDESTLAAERITVQNPSDTRYMMVVSLIGGLLVAGRLLRDWRVDIDRLTLVPRERARLRSDDGSGSTYADGSQTRETSETLTGGERRG
jgi:cytochrome c-type biogenesis protein CcmE